MSGWAKIVRMIEATIVLVALGHDREHVAHEVHPATLPAGALQHGLDRVHQPGVSVRDDQLHPVRARGPSTSAGTSVQNGS